MLGLKSSIALNPQTPVSVLDTLQLMPNTVLLMSVEPGFSGQEFLEITWDRLKELAELRKKLKASFNISVDGGVNGFNLIN